VRSQSRTVNIRSAVDDFDPHHPVLSLAREPFRVSVSALISAFTGGVKPKGLIFWSWATNCHPRTASLPWPSGGIRLVSQIPDHASTVCSHSSAVYNTARPSLLR
jgi:hypothetical protein